MVGFQAEIRTPFPSPVFSSPLSHEGYQWEEHRGRNNRVQVMIRSSQKRAEGWLQSRQKRWVESPVVKDVKL